MQSEQVFKKILLPVDGSIPSLIAQELTVFIAKKLNSKVTVFHAVSHEFMSSGMQRFFQSDRHEHVPIGAGVQPPPVLHSHERPATSLSEEVAREIVNWYHQRGEQAIADAVALFKEEGIPIDQKLVEHTDPAEAVLKEAQEENFDLIIMGYSEEEEKGPHLGSVAEKISRHAKTSVLIVRGKRHISKILVPIDGSENAEKALLCAHRLAKKTDAKMTLLYIQESSLFELRPEVTKEVGTRILSDAANKVKDAQIDKKLESGDPAKTIIQIANKGGYDLIVMGSRGLGTIGRFLLGSVSDHVTHHVNRSVLMVK